MRIRPVALVIATALVLSVACGTSGTPQPTATPTGEPTPTPVPTDTVSPTVSPTPSPTRLPSGRGSFARRSAFVPLDNPQVLTAQEAGFATDDELILGLEWQGKAHAYPIRMLTYHHIVNDTVEGSPILITF